MSQYEIEQAGGITIVGRLKALHGATGDVPTQQANGELQQAPGGGSVSGLALYGAGIDGPIHVNANPFTLADPVFPGLNVITANVLQRSVNLDSLTIDPGCELDTNAWMVRVKGTLLNAGRIFVSTNGSANALSNPWGVIAGVAAGNPGTDGTTTSEELSPSVGGAGGSAGGQAGGVCVSNPGIIMGGNGYPAIGSLTVFLADFGGLNQNYVCPSGGSGGNDTYTGTSGTGGCGGGIVVIAAKMIDNSAGTIEANGDDGGAPTGGVLGDAGGGGGGPGGIVCLLYNTATFGTEQALAGSGGAGAGAGTAGADGVDGLVIKLANV